MPQVGFICPIEREEVPFDHFDHCTAKGGRPAFPPWAASQMAAGVLGDVRHAGIAITATGIMGCPRQRFLNMTQDYYADPTWSFAAARGTALHSTAAKHLNPEVWYSEATDPVRMDLIGRLWKDQFEEDGDLVTAEGVRVSALTDGIRRDMTEILDWKFPKDWSVRYRNKDGTAKPEHKVQLNEARLLLGQQEWAIKEGYDPDNVLLTLWDHALGATDGPAALAAAHMTDMEMLDMSTGPDSEYLIGDVIAQSIKDYQVWKGMNDLASEDQHPSKEDVEKYAASIPCMGEAKFRGTGCQKYCSCRSVSAKLMRKYGRPEEMGKGSEPELSLGEAQDQLDGELRRAAK